MKKILLIKEMGKNLVTRNSLARVLKKINKTKIILDFKSIKFISRSCADEYLNFKQKSKTKITEIGLSKAVKKMLDAVAKSHEDNYEKEIMNQEEKKYEVYTLER